MNYTAWNGGINYTMRAGEETEKRHETKMNSINQATQWD